VGGDGRRGELAAAGADTRASQNASRADHILAAASRAIVRRGFEATRIADIAREAGTSTGTVHYHFETKDVVLVAALTRANYESYEPIEEVLASAASSAAALGRLVELSIPYEGVQRDWWVLWIELWTRVLRRPDLRARSELVSTRWRRYFVDTIEAGIGRGEFRPVAAAADVADRLAALIDGLAFQVVVGHHWMPAERMRELVLAFASEQLRVPSAELEQGAGSP
jgi:AcrR family transcriptional regulator